MADSAPPIHIGIKKIDYHQECEYPVHMHDSRELLRKPDICHNKYSHLQQQKQRDYEESAEQKPQYSLFHRFGQADYSFVVIHSISP